MAKLKVENTRGVKTSPIPDGERVVISGMAGLFPQCHSVKELRDVLYNKVNPITADSKRWQYTHPEVPEYAGSVPELDRFDAQFFGVHYRLGTSMDSMSRKLLEQMFQAIYDAGLSPDHLSGKKVGVYIGTCFSETEKASFYVASTRTGFGIVGCSKAMFANRISYWLNAKGPSLAIDEACCSSTVALEQAYLAMARGECDAAIVGGANISLHPQSLVHYSRILKLCMDGKTKSFDENADGCAKTEAINVLFLQKAKDALRIYGDLMHVKSEFLSREGDSGPVFGFYRDPLVVGKFLKTFYEKAGVPPQAVEYVEAFGSAVPEVDKAELEAISDIFGRNRDDPLLVGSVMSNIGYAEAATGISAIIKVLLGYREGELAANLHCSNPRKDVPALQEGRIRIVTEHQPFERGFTAVNNLSVTGCNVHILLHGHYKPKDLSKYKTTLPYLVTISGRQEIAVQNLLDNLKSRPIDPEEIALLHNIHQMKISGHLGRGFTILDTNPNQTTVSLASECEYFDDARRPLWFVYSGMGSQWPEMGKQLMRIPVFAAAIERCQKALQVKGVDLVHIITTSDKKIFENILHSFVGIAAVQIGLTDVLHELGLVPDKIIGHSVGELGCAYADGCFTAEEMILSAYSRGLVSLQTQLIRGSMAAVGLSYLQIITMVPPEIEVACHNSSDSCTISGPSEVMREFVSSLAAKGIFAKEVPCSNIAYHSRYIADAGPGLLKYLSEVIKDPKPRSERWVSTSIPQDRWDDPAAKYSSAEYHTNNLLNPVLFEEASKLIPANAVLVEIAPHGLLQAILKRSLPTCKHVPLTRRGHPDNPFLVLEAVGKLFMEGYNPKVEVLYPKVEFPVSTETPFLSHLVEWAHHEKWSLPLYMAASRKTAAACMFTITTHDEEHNYLLGNVIKGKNVYPFAASLVAIWDTLAMSSGVPKKQLSVKFHDVKLYVQPILNRQQPLKLSVAFHRGNGRFEILHGKSIVATGYIEARSKKVNNRWKSDVESEDEMMFNSEDIYQLLCEREYLYKGSFQSIKATNGTFSKAFIAWDNNWVTFIDGILQLNVLRQEYESVSQVAYIKSLSIDVNEHLSTDTIDLNGKSVIKATVCDLHEYTRCGGIVIKNIKFSNLPPSKSMAIKLKTLQFVPRFQTEIIDMKAAIQIYIQIVAENTNKNEINVVELQNENEDHFVIDFDVNDTPGIKVNYKLLKNREFVEMNHDDLVNIDLTIINSFSNANIITDKLPAGAFLVISENNDMSESKWQSSACRVVSSYNTGNIRLSLARRNPQQKPNSTQTITVLSTTDFASLISKRESLSSDQKLVILTSYPPVNGMKDLISQWRASQQNVCLVMVNHKIAKDQRAAQLPDLDLVFNVLQYGLLGGEYYVPFTSHNKQSKVESKNVTLEIEKNGDLESLQWVEIPDQELHGQKVMVHYAGLSTMDVKKATSMFSARNTISSKSFGMDYSGITDSGVRVMGIVPSGACSKWITAIPELMWPVPDHWTMEEAATVPLAYAHAFYCLAIKVHLSPNSSILIHGGAGALGQAAISICLAAGLQVFVTVSDIRKKRFLRRLFPELKDENIGCSRDNTFGDMIKLLTKGDGVQYILNSVPGELKNISLRCAGFSGIVLDTDQLAKNEDYTYGMFNMTMSRNYMPVDFSSIFTSNKNNELLKLQLLISEGITRGYVRPLSRVSYEPCQAAQALRLVQASQHRGRVLLRLVDTPLRAQHRISCSPGKTHILVCDEEFCGVQFADQLVASGVRKLLLNLPKIPTLVQRKKLSWEKRGVEVKVTAINLSEKKGLNSLFKEAIAMGTIEGICFVSIANDKANREVLSGIDVLSRKLCTSLSFFSVISTDKDFGNRICISRVQDKLPATKLSVPWIKEINSERKSNFWRIAVEVMEAALRSSDRVIYAQIKNETRYPLLKKIAALSDKTVLENLTHEAVLKECGINEVQASAIGSLLRNEHNLMFSEEDILSLTLQQIQDIEHYTNGFELKKIRGLDVFFSHVDSDELMATTDTVYMTTLAGTVSMKDYHEDISKKSLCIVPGLEGNYERFNELCERIKMPALVLQPGLDFPNETVKELAERYAKILIKKSSIEKDFYLLGYESGVMVALEVAAILEDYGLEGTIFCIGAAPTEFQAWLEEELREFSSEDALQDAVVRHMYRLILGSPCDLDLGNLTWDEKVDRCVRAVLGRTQMSAQYARAQFEAVYGRIAQARAHHPDARALRSKVVLLHAAGELVYQSDNTSSSHPISELQQYSQLPISVYELRTPISHSLQDLRCASVINQHLHLALLQEFEAKNLCETYLMNADTFLNSHALSDDS